MSAKQNRYGDDDVLHALRSAADEMGEPLSAERYDAFQSTNGGPTSARVIQRHGTWNAACSAAGLKLNPARAGYRRRWTRAELASYVATYLGEQGSGSYAGYAEWARGTAGAPSAQTVRNAFSGWAAAKEAARGIGSAEA